MLVPDRFLQRRFVPVRDFQRVQVIDDGEGIEFVQIGHYITVFNVCQPADVSRRWRFERHDKSDQYFTGLA